MSKAKNREESELLVYTDLFCGHRYFPESILKESEGKSVQECCVPNPKDKEEMDVILKRKGKTW